MSEQPLGPEVDAWPRALPARVPLAGVHVALEPLHRRHAAELFEAMRDDAASFAYMTYGPFATVEALREFVAAQAARHDPMFWAVRPVVTGRVSGWLALLNIDPANAAIELGSIWFGPALRRTRAATEAMFLLLDLAAEGLGYERLVWNCNALNAPSRRAAARLGFVPEGVARAQMKVKGRRRDTATHSITAAEWPARREAVRRWLAPENFAPDGTALRGLAELRGEQESGLSDAPPITVETIAAAEAVLGVRYSAAERALMVDNLAPQVALAVRRREMVLPHTLAPALRFDPRLPGFEMPRVAPFAWAPGDATKLPAADEDIAHAPVTELAGWIRHGALSAARLTRIYLARIERLNPVLLCFARVTAEAALRRADELDRLLAAGTWLGPLHGIPYGMKDLIDTAGVETDWGAEPFLGRMPAEDAHVTTLLHQAGAVLLGKTTLGALAYGDIWHGGQTRNPWNPEEGSSGSSAGSAAAVAAGLVGFAIGSETLGSIVSPATRCGATGLRPTFGRVSRRGAMPLCWSTDKIGPLCRAVADTALVLDALNGADPRDPFQIPAPLGAMAGPVAGLRVGYFAADFEDADAHELDRAALDAVRALGLALTPLPRADLPYDTLMAVIEADAAAVFEALTLSGGDDLLSWQDEAAWPNSFRKARFLSAVDYVQLDRLRRLVMQEMDAHFRAVDLIIGPSLVGPMLVQTNFTGHPCLCMPVGLRPAPARGTLFGRAAPTQAEYEVPHAICLWGRLFDEGPMLALGAALEAQFGMARRRPPLHSADDD